MRFNHVVLAAALLLCWMVVGCQADTPKKDAATSTTKSSTSPREFFSQGEVMEMDAAKKKVTVKHQEIPNYMPAMTMPFPVKDVKELDNVKVGDTISFRLLVKDKDGWIDRVVVLKSASMGKPPTHETTRLVRDVDPLNVGDLIPDYPFTNQLNQVIHFGDYRGQALAVTFIFTRCPFPVYCPHISDNFTKVSAKMKAMKDGPKNWHLFSMTFDPEYDTPQHLKTYGELYNYDPEHWSFLTGKMIDIDAITEQFGVTFARELGTFQFNHNLRTAIIDTQGRVQKIIVGNEWQPDDVVAELLKAAAVKPTKKTAAASSSESKR